jgi:hypothetical protein
LICCGYEKFWKHDTKLFEKEKSGTRCSFKEYRILERMIEYRRNIDKAIGDCIAKGVKG